VAVSLATRAPKAKADEFLDYLADKLRSGNYV